MENTTRDDWLTSTPYTLDGDYSQNYAPPPPPPDPPPGGQYPYYPQPGYGYPNTPITVYPSRPSVQQQHQQQSVVFVNANQPVILVRSRPPVPLCGAICLACVVCWFCGWLLGGIAFILAVVGQSSYAAGDIRGAIQLRNASYGLSIAGIVVGIIIIAVVGGILGSAASAANKAASNYNQLCYDSFTQFYYYCNH